MIEQSDSIVFANLRMSSLWQSTRYNPKYIDPNKTRRCRVCKIWKKEMNLIRSPGMNPICTSCNNYCIIGCTTPNCNNAMLRSDSAKCYVCKTVVCRSCHYKWFDEKWKSCFSCERQSCQHSRFTDKCKTCTRSVCQQCSQNESHCKWCLTFFICKRVNPEFPRDCIKIICGFLG